MIDMVLQLLPALVFLSLAFMVLLNIMFLCRRFPERRGVFTDGPHGQAAPVGVAADSAPPSVRLSAPVCFCRIEYRGSPRERSCVARITSGHMASASMLEETALLVEVDGSVHPGHVQEKAIRCELLTAIVTSAANRQPAAAMGSLTCRVQHRSPDVFNFGWADDSADGGRVQP